MTVFHQIELAHHANEAAADVHASTGWLKYAPAVSAVMGTVGVILGGAELIREFTEGPDELVVVQDGHTGGIS